MHDLDEDDPEAHVEILTGPERVWMRTVGVAVTWTVLLGLAAYAIAIPYLERERAAAPTMTFAAASAGPPDAVCVGAHPRLDDRLGVVATARASFYFYNTPEEVDLLCAGLEKAAQIFAL